MPSRTDRLVLSANPSITQAKSVIRALNGETHARPPFWFMRQAGRYLPEYRQLRAKARDFVSLCLTPELAAEITLQPIRRYGMDAAILFADILLVPYALGQNVMFQEGRGPVLDPVRTHEQVAGLADGLDAAMGRLGPVCETVRRVAANLPVDTTLIGFAGAPWTVATYMVEGGTSRDFAHVRRWALGDPEGFQQLIDLLVESTVRYLAAQIDSGAEAVQIFDTWAGVLPDDAFHRWCVAPVRDIVDQLRIRHPAVPIIAFPRGAGISYRDYPTLTGVSCIGIDASVPPAWARDVLQPQAAVQGNLDPELLVVGGKAMTGAATRILRALAPGPFVFNLGHGIGPETPPAHVGQLCDFLRRWRN